MNAGAHRHRLVQRIDLYLLGVMLVSAGLAAILFWILALSDTATEEESRQAEPTDIVQVSSPTTSPTQTPQISRTPTPTRTLLPTFIPTDTVAFSPTPSPTLWPSPQVEPLAIGNLYAEEPLFISGEAQPGDRIILTDFGEPIGETIAGEDGTWTFVFEGGLASGPHELGVIAENETGRQSAPAAVNFLLNERPTSTPTHTPTDTDTPSPTSSPTATATSTASATASSTTTSTPSATASPSLTATLTASSTATASVTASLTPTRTASVTASSTQMATITVTATQTPTTFITPSETRLRIRETDTHTPTSSPSSTSSSTSTLTSTLTDTPSLTLTPTETLTATTSISPTSSLTATSTATASFTPSEEPTATPTSSRTRTSTATPSPTPSQTVTPTTTASPTFTVTATPTSTQEFVTPRIISPEDGTVLQTGEIRLIGTGEVGAELEIIDSERNILGTVTVDEDQRWALAIFLNQSGEIALQVRDTARPARPSPVVRLTLAPPIQPETGIQLFEENSDTHGILYTLMLALVSISLGSALIFAGRILYALSRQG